METITVAASRSAFGLSETQLLAGSVILIALLGWMLLARLRRARQPHA